MVKSADAFAEDLGSLPTPTLHVSALPVTSVLGVPGRSFGLCWHQAPIGLHIYAHRDTHKIKTNLKKIKKAYSGSLI